MKTVFALHGIKLPRTAAEQSTGGLPGGSLPVIPGDQLYFRERSGLIGHTAIYIGGGYFIHASSNRGAVAIDALTNPTYWHMYACARR